MLVSVFKSKIKNKVEEMKTYRISEEEIKGLSPVDVGYKIFNNDWTAKSGNYDYKDENGNVLNTIHKVDGVISECNWGLHFSKKPQDCFSFYECVQWNKFAKVEAYDKCDFGDMWTVDEVVYGIKIGYPAFDLNRHDWEINGLSNLNESGQYYYEVIGNIHDNKLEDFTK